MSSRTPCAAAKSKLFFLWAITTLIIGCSPEKQARTPDALIGLWNARFNEGHMVLQKVNQVAYDPLDNSAVLTFEPAPAGEANLLKMRYDPKKDIGDQLKVDKSRLSDGSLSQLRISADGKHTALSGRSRELFLFKNQQYFAKLDLDDELTCMEFGGKDGHIIAIGDRKGKLILIDLEKAAIMNTAQLFNGEVTSISFFKDGQVLVTGKDSRIIQVDVVSGKTTRIIETQALKEKILHATGLRHCHKERINQVLYVESENKIVTTHGWDYCQDARVAVWDASNGNLVKEIRQIKHPVYHMVWASKLNSWVLADHDRNLWRLSLPDYKLTGPIHLPQTSVRYSSPTKDQVAATTFGNVQSMVSIPGTPLLLIGIGSYFKGGSGVLLAELIPDSIKNIAHLTIDIRGNAQLFVREELFHKMKP